MIIADRNLIVDALTVQESNTIRECIEESKKIGVDLSTMNQATHKGCIFSTNRYPIHGLYKFTNNIWQEVQFYNGLRLELSSIRLQDYIVGLLINGDGEFDLRKSSLLKNGRYKYYRDHGFLAQSIGVVEIVDGLAGR